MHIYCYFIVTRFTTLNSNTRSYFVKLNAMFVINNLIFVKENLSKDKKHPSFNLDAFLYLIIIYYKPCDQSCN
ncbi:hypothetical protein CLOSBL3_12568 [Clostridiaceae bacterium BL-3]|nr:hypothetical protein CLOSBL3_12568 [Clostridiaceae bacterium BL-3]